MTAGDELLERTGVVVVAHARTDLALRCFGSLPSSLQRERLVAVVNAPELASPDGLAQLRETATLVTPPRRQGYGANLNLGVRSLPAGLDYLLLANDDVEFVAGSLEKLLETMRDDPRIGLVGPALRQLRGRESKPFPQFPSVADVLLDTTALPLGPGWAALARRAGRPEPVHPAERAANGWVVGAAMLVRAEAFRAVGGFDEDFFLYFEETDFCHRLREAGWSLAWRADAPVDHVHGESADPRYASLFFQSQRLYFRKRLGRVRLALLQAVLVALFAAGVLYNLAATAVRPSTARRRCELLRDRWRTRMFLRGRGTVKSP